MENDINTNAEKPKIYSIFQTLLPTIKDPPKLIPRWSSNFNTNISLGKRTSRKNIANTNNSHNRKIFKPIPSRSKSSKNFLPNKPLKTDRNLFLVISYLDFPDIISLKNTSKLFYNALKGKSKLLKQYVRKGLITSPYRRQYYSYIINYNKIKQNITTELSKKLELNVKFNDLYSKIITNAKKEITDDSFESKRVDILFKSMDKIIVDKIKNLIIAIKFVRNEVIFNDNIIHIIKTLIVFFDDEDFSFWTFLVFIDFYEVNQLYNNKYPYEEIRKFQFFHFYKNIFNDLDPIKAKVDQYEQNFYNIFRINFSNFFANYLNKDVLIKLYDIFIIDGWKCMFKYCFVFLKLMINRMTQMDSSASSKYLKEHSYYASVIFNKDMIDKYMEIKITNGKLKSLVEDYFIKKVTEKLNNKETKWEDDQIQYISKYKKKYDLLAKSYEKTIKDYKSKISTLSKDCQVLLKEYKTQEVINRNLKLKIELLIEMKQSYESASNGLNANFIEQFNNAMNEEADKKISLSKIGITTISFRNVKENDLTEHKKIRQKIEKIDKDIDKANKGMMESYQLLDMKKFKYEKKMEEKDDIGLSLLDVEKKFEEDKLQLIKVLSEELKLSIKFVTTSNF